MKAVLISTQPKWVEKIANRQKKIEVRKTAPKQVPFKGYIYCTSSDVHSALVVGDGDAKLIHCCNYKSAIPVGGAIGNSKVIGEFVCDKVIKTCGWRLRGNTQQCAKRTTDEESFPELACLTIDEIVKYAGSENREVCGWHISDLKIYDKPKELSEFKTPPCEKSEKACENCKWLVKINTPNVYECECYVEDGRPITRPPQSYMYVEEI